MAKLVMQIKAQPSNKSKADLSKQVTSLSNTVSSLQSKLKNSSTGPPLYKVGSTQCIKSFCITLDNDYLDPASNSPGGGLIQSDNLFSVELTVTNNGPVPSSHSSPSPNSEMGIPDGSLIYTSDNLFSGPYGGNGVATNAQSLALVMTFMAIRNKAKLLKVAWPLKYRLM